MLRTAIAIALLTRRRGNCTHIFPLPSEERDDAETARLVREVGRRAVSFPDDLMTETFCKALRT